MYRLGIYEKAMPESLSLTEKLEAAKRLGFDFAEMSVDESDLKLARLDMPARERERLLSAMCRGGIHYESMCLSAHRKYPLGSRDAAARAKSLEIGEKAVVLARDLGIRMIQLAGYDVYYQESGADTAAYFEESLKALTGYASQYGVVLAFETMETPFMNTVKKAM
ncbi:MAG: L-ribulose-5-phosphate 3-epimerase, partial [Christensenellales bacterium]